MADLYEDYGLEMEPEGFGADPDLEPKKTTIVKKKGGALGKVVALLLGFVIGAGGVIGGVAGAGYYVLNTPVDKAVGTINNFTGLDIDYSQFVSEEYASSTVLGLVGEIADVAASFTSGKGCLNDLAKISPYVSTALDPLLETLKDYGLELDKNEFLNTPVSQLSTYITEEAKAIALADILNTVGIANTPILEAICYDKDGNAVTVGDVMEGGPEGLIQNVPLEALIIDTENGVNPEADTLIMALAYGNKNRYTVGSDNKVVMNPMEFSRIGNVLYDIDGNEVAGAVLNEASGVFTITDGEEVYYASPNAVTRSISSAIPYYGYEDEACNKVRLYQKTMIGDLMSGNASELFNTLELGTLFNVSPLDEEPDPIMLALAYGEKGTHYEIENGKITWLNGNKPRTIGTLLEGEVSSLMDELKLGTLLDISPLDKYYKTGDKANPDPIMLSLAYGEEGTHYDIVEKNGEYVIEWKLKDAESETYYSARTLGELTGGASGIFESIQLGTVLGISPLDKYYKTGEEANPNSLMLALAYGYEGTHYNIVEDDGEYAIKWIKPNKPKTILSLTEGNALDEIRLATVLDIEIDDELTNDNRLTHALAFGYEGTHYEWKDLDDDGDLDVEWKEKPENPEKPGVIEYYDYRTVGNMSEMGNMLDELRLATVLNIEIDDELTDDNRLTHALAFGYEDTHYKWKDLDGDGDLDVDWQEDENGDEYSYRTVGSMSGMGEIINELRLGTVLGIDATTPITKENALTHAIAYGYAGEHFEINGDEVTWLNGNQPRTVEDMSTMGKILDEIRIETALSVTHKSPRLLVALAYGSEGTDYKYDKNTDGEITGIYDITNYNTIGNLSSEENNIIDSLKLKDMLGTEAIEDDLLLSHLGEATLTTLPQEIEKLTFKQVYPEQIYDTRYLTTDGIELFYDSVNKQYYYESAGGTTVYNKEVTVQFKVEYVEDYLGETLIAPGEWPSVIVDGWINQADLDYHDNGYYHVKTENVEDQYQVHLQLTSQWKYLLQSSDGETHDYNMTEFASLVDNMTWNMQNKTLRQLAEDGIIQFDPEELDKHIFGIESLPTIGELTIDSLLAILSQPLPIT